MHARACGASLARGVQVQTVSNAVPWQSAIIVITALEGYTCSGIPTATYESGGPDVDLPLYDQEGNPLGINAWSEPGVYMVDLRGAVSFRLRAGGSSQGWKAVMTLLPDPMGKDFTARPRPLPSQTQSGGGGLTVHTNTRRHAMVHFYAEAIEGYTLGGGIKVRYYSGGPEVDLPLYDAHGNAIGTTFTAAGAYLADLRGVYAWRFFSASSTRGFKVTATLLPNSQPLYAAPKPHSETQFITLGGSAATYVQFDDVERWQSVRYELTVPSDSPNPTQFRAQFRREEVSAGAGTRPLPIYRENGVWHDHMWAREQGAFAVDLTNTRKLRILADAGHYSDILLTFSEDKLITHPMAMDVGSYRSVIIESGALVQGHFSGFEVLDPAVIHSNTIYARKTGSELTDLRAYPVSADELPLGHFEPGPFDAIRLVSGRVRAFYR